MSRSRWYCRRVELEARPARCDVGGMRPSPQPVLHAAPSAPASRRASPSAWKPLARPRLREHDQADQRHEDQRRTTRKRRCLRDLQDLVLDEPREPHTVSPPVISRNTSSSDASAAARRRRRRRRPPTSARRAVGHLLRGDPRPRRRLARRPRVAATSAAPNAREHLRRPRAPAARRTRTPVRPRRGRAAPRTGPVASVRPRWMIATRSHICSTSESRWLDTKTAIPRSVGEAAHELADLADAGRIEAVGGLVEDQDVRIAEQRLRDAEALAHAERVGRDLVVQPLGRARRARELRDPLGRARRAACARSAAGSRGRSGTGRGRATRRCSRRAPSPARSRARRRGRGSGRGPRSGRASPTSMRIVVVLPAPLGPRKPKTSPARHLEGHVGDRLAVAEPLGQVLGREDDLARRTATELAKPRSSGLNVSSPLAWPADLSRFWLWTAAARPSGSRPRFVFAAGLRRSRCAARPASRSARRRPPARAAPCRRRAQDGVGASSSSATRSPGAPATRRARASPSTSSRRSASAAPPRSRTSASTAWSRPRCARSSRRRTSARSRPGRLDPRLGRAATTSPTRVPRAGSAAVAVRTSRSARDAYAQNLRAILAALREANPDGADLRPRPLRSVRERHGSARLGAP